MENIFEAEFLKDVQENGGTSVIYGQSIKHDMYESIIKVQLFHLAAVCSYSRLLDLSDLASPKMKEIGAYKLAGEFIGAPLYSSMT